MSKVIVNNKVWDRDAIIELLKRDDKAVARALVALFERQTSSEQVSSSTHIHNNRGFAHCDAFIMSQYAKFFQSRGYLTQAQIALCRKPNKNGVPRIAKYAGQLLEVIRERQAA